MLHSLFASSAASAVTKALESARVESGSLAVIGQAKLAASLAELGKGVEIVAVAVSARATKKLPNVRADLDAIGERSLAGVVGSDVAADDAWETTLARWTQVVRDRGVIVFIDKGHAAEASRRALCAGLSEIEQRHAGRSIITSGIVSHL
jgi:hypothetical protein